MLAHLFYLQYLRGVKNDCETAYLRVCCVWQNLGCIKSSNLCTEIIEYTDPDEVRFNLTYILISARLHVFLDTNSSAYIGGRLQPGLDLAQEVRDGGGRFRPPAPLRNCLGIPLPSHQLSI